MVIEFQIKEIDSSIKSHSHTYGQFIYPLEGCVFLETDEKKQIIDEKSLGYVPPGKDHRFHSDRLVRQLLINLGDRMIKDEDRSTFENNAPFILDKNLLTIMGILKNEAESQNNRDSMKYLFFYLYEKLSETRTYKCITHIHNNYPYDIPIKTLADLENYSLHYFTDWFKKHIGMSPVSYIKRVRMEEAKNLLLTTKYNLTQIAMQTGYSQSSTMCKVFKELEKCTPGEFRTVNG